MFDAAHRLRGVDVETGGEVIDDPSVAPERRHIFVLDATAGERRGERRMTCR